MHLINCFSATFEENTNNINLKVRSLSTTHASQSRFWVAKCISSSQRIVSISDILFHSMTVTKLRNFTFKSIYIIMHISNMFESSIWILKISNSINFWDFFLEIGFDFYEVLFDVRSFIYYFDIDGKCRVLLLNVEPPTKWYLFS